MSAILQGLTLPASSDAEQMVLGAAMRDTQSAEVVTSLLLPSDFASELNQSIYTSLADLHNRGIRADSVTIANDMLANGRFPQRDGLTYLTSLGEGLPKLYSLESYIDIVQEKSTLRTAIKLSASVIEECLKGGASAKDMATRAEKLVATFTQSKRDPRDVPRTIGQIVEGYGGFNDFLQRKHAHGFRIPIKILDSTLDGLRPNKLNIWAGRPGEGKTSLLIQCAERCADQGGKPLIVSAEMEAVDLVTRSLVGRSKVSAYRFRKNRLNDNERLMLIDQLAAMMSYEERLLIYDRPDVNVQTLRYLLRQATAQGVARDSLWIDFVQLMEALGVFRSRTEELGAISKGLVAIKKEFGIPVTVLSQVSREGDVKGNRSGKGGHDEPYEKHIAESDKLVQAADSILIIWRSLKEMERQANYPSPVICMNWKIPKNRDGMKNRGGINEDGNEQQPIYFNERETRFVEDLDVNTPDNYMEAA